MYRGWPWRLQAAKAFNVVPLYSSRRQDPLLCSLVMDPVSLTASIAGLVGFAEKLQRVFDASFQALKPSDEEALVLRVHLGILEDISRVILDSTTELPSTTQSCGQLCQRRLQSLYKIIISHETAKTKPSTKEMIKLQNSVKQPIADFASSVQLYRDVVMKYAICGSLISRPYTD